MTFIPLQNQIGVNVSGPFNHCSKLIWRIFYSTFIMTSSFHHKNNLFKSTRNMIQFFSRVRFFYGSTHILLMFYNNDFTDSHSINDAFISENHFVTPINSCAREQNVTFFAPKRLTSQTTDEGREKTKNGSMNPT